MEPFERSSLLWLAAVGIINGDLRREELFPPPVVVVVVAEVEPPAEAEPIPDSPGGDEEGAANFAPIDEAIRMFTERGGADDVPISDSLLASLLNPGSAALTLGGLGLAAPPPLRDLIELPPEPRMTTEEQLTAYMDTLVGLPVNPANVYAYPVALPGGGYGHRTTGVLQEARVAAAALVVNGVCAVCSRSHAPAKHVASQQVVGLVPKSSLLKNYFSNPETRRVWVTDSRFTRAPDWTAPSLSDFYQESLGGQICSRCPASGGSAPARLTFASAMELIRAARFKPELDQVVVPEERFFGHLLSVHTGDLFYYLYNDILPYRFKAPFNVYFQDFVNKFYFLSRVRDRTYLMGSNYRGLSDAVVSSAGDEAALDAYAGRLWEARAPLEAAWRRRLGLSSLPPVSRVVALMKNTKGRNSWSETALIDKNTAANRKRQSGAGGGGQAAAAKRPAEDPTWASLSKRVAVGVPTALDFGDTVNLLLPPGSQRGDIIYTTAAYRVVHAGFYETGETAEALAELSTVKYLMDNSIFGNCFQTALVPMAGSPQPGPSRGGAAQSVVQRTLALLFVSNVGSQATPLLSLTAPGTAGSLPQMVGVLESSMPRLLRAVRLVMNLGRFPVWEPSQAEYRAATGEVLLNLQAGQRRLTLGENNLGNYLVLVNVILTGSAAPPNYTAEESALLTQRRALSDGITFLQNMANLATWERNTANFGPAPPPPRLVRVRIGDFNATLYVTGRDYKFQPLGAQEAARLLGAQG